MHKEYPHFCYLVQLCSAPTKLYAAGLLHLAWYVAVDLPALSFFFPHKLLTWTLIITKANFPFLPVQNSKAVAEMRTVIFKCVELLELEREIFQPFLDLFSQYAQ